MNLHPLIHDLRVCRNNMIKVLNSVAPEYWETIPAGFSNNLFWNAAHVVVTQQLLCYKLAGLSPFVSDSLIDRYRKGTYPPEELYKGEAKEVLELLLSSVEQTEKHLEGGLFENREFKEYPTSFGITLHSVEEAMRFNNVHEGLHLGYAMAIRKALSGTGV